MTSGSADKVLAEINKLDIFKDIRYTDFDAAVAEANAKGDAIMEAKILEAEKYYSEKTKDIVCVNLCKGALWNVS